MFYYRFTITESVDAPEGGKELSNRKVFRQYGTGAFALCGEDVATMLANSKVTVVKVQKINQAAYVRATRPND